MNACFADTSYFIALVSPDDEAHAEATRYTADFDGVMVTTEWVLNEFANFLTRPPNRQLFLAMLADLRADPRVVIVKTTDATFEDGIALYGERFDKEWSVTDCISFVVMERERITDALTKDHQGFRRLL
ncbi:MAG: nucleic acid-binding protein [Phycisphaerales bacterium]|nr:nucleic acid-binding protein [Phycisphaerales bacterium]